MSKANIRPLVFIHFDKFGNADILQSGDAIVVVTNEKWATNTATVLPISNQEAEIHRRLAGRPIMSEGTDFAIHAVHEVRERLKP